MLDVTDTSVLDYEGGSHVGDKVVVDGLGLWAREVHSRGEIIDVHYQCDLGVLGVKFVVIIRVRLQFGFLAFVGEEG